MLPHVDFTEQENVRDADGKNLRPDMTVKLAGGRTIVVDSKVALSGAARGVRDGRRERRAENGSPRTRVNVSKHVDDLAGKKYWEQFDSAPEFVVMFVPSEAFYKSAVEQDAALQEYAFTKRRGDRDAHHARGACCARSPTPGRRTRSRRTRSTYWQPARSCTSASQPWAVTSRVWAARSIAPAKAYNADRRVDGDARHGVRAKVWGDATHLRRVASARRCGDGTSATGRA